MFPPAEQPERRSRLSLAPIRRTLASIPLFKPRWKPWSPQRVAAVATGFGLLMGVLVLVTYRFKPKHWLFSSWLPTPSAEIEEAETPKVTPARADGPRADASLAREGRSPLAGGLLTIAPGFSSEDGTYDLVIHFHGNTDLVEESFFTSGINAVIVALNLGNGSGPYEDRFGNPASLPEMLGRVDTTLEKRGLVRPKRGRLALTAWSAGYGAVIKTLEQPALARDIDAIILLDGIHVGYKPNSDEVQTLRLDPFERFAREAMEGKRLFSITHSRIVPVGHYLGTQETTDLMLEHLGVRREEGGDRPEMPALKSIVGVLPKDKMVRLEPRSTVKKGGLVVRGYGGDQPEHHMAHLMQMVNTALPDLVQRWRAPR